MLRVCVFALFCIIFDLTSGYHYYYNNQHRHGHGCHYQQQQCVVRRGHPICKQWCLLYYFDGYCYRPKYECCAYQEKPGYCPLDLHSCSRPFYYYSTRIHECHHDFSCPIGYKCCKDSCYVHKVCKPCVAFNPGTSSTGPTRDTEETTPKNPGTPTKRPETITPEFFTTTPQETTTRVVTTTTTEITTTEKVTTVAPTTIPTTTKETTTQEAVTTTQIVTTTPSPTTTNIPTTTTQADTTPLTTASPKTTTVEDVEVSGSGDFEIPDPESARFMKPKNVFDTFSDDEDFVKNIMDN